MNRKRTFLYLAYFLLISGRVPCPGAPPYLSVPGKVKLDAVWVKEESPELCGLAAVEMVTDYYGQKLNDGQKDLLRACAKKGSGIKGSDLLMVIRTCDYEGAVFYGTLSPQGPAGLYYNLGQRRPLIVMLTSKDGRNSQYDLVVGYHLKQGKIFVLDPSIGPMAFSIKDFAPAWERAHFFTLLAMPEKRVDPPTPSTRR